MQLRCIKVSKKKGFTLAEVLVTLGVIGIIAALTIPAITLDIHKKKTIAILKETYSLFSQVTNYMIAENGNGLSGVFAGGSNALFDNYSQYIKFVKAVKLNAYNYKVYLNNGSSVILESNDQTSHCGNAVVRDPITSENIGCLTIHIDVNGDKSPNVYGKDIFVMAVHKNGTIPMGSDYYYTRHGGTGSSWTTCNSTNYPDFGTCFNDRCSASCLSRIIIDGWEINYY